MPSQAPTTSQRTSLAVSLHQSNRRVPVSWKKALSGSALTTVTNLLCFAESQRNKVFKVFDPDFSLFCFFKTRPLLDFRIFGFNSCPENFPTPNTSTDPSQSQQSQCHTDSHVSRCRVTVVTVSLSHVTMSQRLGVQK
jgi:hypothetical protein